MSLKKKFNGDKEKIHNTTDGGYRLVSLSDVQPYFSLSLAEKRSGSLDEASILFGFQEMMERGSVPHGDQSSIVKRFGAGGSNNFSVN